MTLNMVGLILGVVGHVEREELWQSLECILTPSLRPEEREKPTKGTEKESG